MLTNNNNLVDIPEVNNIYRNELIKYLKLRNTTNKFIEGNCYILSERIVNILYTDIKLYNILNNEIDFDYNYIKNKYNESLSIRELYNKYGKVPIECRKNYGPIEHSFERIILNACENFKLY